MGMGFMLLSNGALMLLGTKALYVSSKMNRSSR
jgi:hypothetical protein